MLRIVTAKSLKDIPRSGPTRRNVLLFSGLSAVAVLFDPAGGFAKQPGAVHCYGGLCHRVATLDEMDGIVGHRGVLKASYYDDCRRDRFNTCGLTSSGAVFQPDRPDNAASPIFPDGSVLVVFNPATGKAAVVRINSAGPYHSDRTLDVSRATAEALGFKSQGVAELTVAVLKSPDAEEARYRKLRSYAEVPGFIGAFLTFEAAHAEAAKRMQLLPQPSPLASLPSRGDLARSHRPDQTIVANRGTGGDLSATSGRGPALRARGFTAEVVRSAPVTADAKPAWEEKPLIVALDVRLGIAASVEDFMATARRAARLSRWQEASPPQTPQMRFAERFWRFVSEARIRARPATGSESSGRYDTASRE